MSKRNLRVPVSVTLSVLVLLVVFFLLRGTMSRPQHVVLPEEGAGNESVGDPAENTGDAISRIDIDPSTVQIAIATLQRPEQYTMKVTIERYSDFGSGTDTARAAASDGWMRIDMTRGTETRHVLTNGEITHIWYGSSRDFYTGAAALSADEEQGIPTYEDVLALETETILFADYRLINEVDCIYVETAPSEAGYVQRYWVSVSSGLLVAAEKLFDGEAVYRMVGTDLNLESVQTADFTLPDGTVLLKIAEA